jgi:hypothetical protein
MYYSTPMATGKRYYTGDCEPGCTMQEISALTHFVDQLNRMDSKMIKVFNEKAEFTDNCEIIFTYEGFAAFMRELIKDKLKGTAFSRRMHSNSKQFTVVTKDFMGIKWTFSPTELDTMIEELEVIKN